MPTLYLGNPRPIFDGRPTNDLDAVTKVVVPESRSLDSALRDIVHADGLWRVHGADAPSWVESDDQKLAEAISIHYGCPIGRPDTKEAL